MKRFVFRAQAALDLRRRQEDDARRALAAAEAQERDARAALDAARAMLDDMLQRAGGAELDADIGILIQNRNWIAALRRRVEQCERALHEREAAVREAAALAQAARRKARSLERFREHAWVRYSRDASREEQKVLDDLGVTRFALRGSDAGGDT
jgi:flagellar export protein FliJ